MPHCVVHWGWIGSGILKNTSVEALSKAFADAVEKRVAKTTLP